MKAKTLRLPRVGTWIRVYWMDTDESHDWVEVDNPGKVHLCKEITVGLYRGLTAQGKLRVVPTVSVFCDSQEISQESSEFSISPGCVERIEMLPPAGAVR